MALILQDSEHLFDFWDDIPVIQELERDVFEKIIEQDIRKSVVNILAEGIQDEHPKTGKTMKRHALSATEMRKIINKNRSKEEKVNSPNLYFHLQKLEDYNVIQVVGQIPTGKRFTTYYSRTAKSFIPEDKEGKEGAQCKILKNEALPDLIYRLNPDLSVTEIEEFIEEVDAEINSNNIGDFKTWLRTNQDVLRGLDLDYRHMMDFYNILKNYNARTISLLEKMSELLNIE